MPLFGGSFSKRPTAPMRKSSVRPGRVQKPVLKKPVPQKPAPQGLFGGGRSFKSWQLRRHFRKASPKTRGFSKKYTKKEREGFTGILKQYGAGKSGSFYERGYSQALKKMRKEKMQMRCRTKQDFARKKELERQIRYFEDRQKGI